MTMPRCVGRPQDPLQPVPVDRVKRAVGQVAFHIAEPRAHEEHADGVDAG